MSTDAGQQTTWLTQEAYDRLSAELEEAKGPRRADIVAKIEAARDEGDLKENGGYHAAKDEQGKLEARIRQLTQLLRDAKVGEAPTSSGVAGPGHGRRGAATTATTTPSASSSARARTRPTSRSTRANSPARPGADRQRGRREGDLHAAQRQLDDRRAAVRGALHRLSSRARQSRTVR